MTLPVPCRRSAQRGFTVLEMVVALGIFALFIVVVDLVFIGVHRNTRRVELATDVQQNARIALERLTREIRESGASQVAVGGPAGSMAVVFKSARLASDSSIFCLYVRTRTDPLYRGGCFYWAGAPVPPYPADPPYAAPCSTPSGSPCGTYAPIWQRAIGYYIVNAAGGVRELRRVVSGLTTPDAALPDPATLRGGEAVASFIETFDVSLSGTQFTIALGVRGSATVAGSVLPADMFLRGTVAVRN